MDKIDIIKSLIDLGISVTSLAAALISYKAIKDGKGK